MSGLLVLLMIATTIGRVLDRDGNVLSGKMRWIIQLDDGEKHKDADSTYLGASYYFFHTLESARIWIQSHKTNLKSVKLFQMNEISHGRTPL